MFTISKMSDPHIAKKGRRNAMKREEIDALTQAIACTSKATWPFVLYKPVPSGAEVQSATVLTATKTFVIQEYLTSLTSAQY